MGKSICNTKGNHKVLAVAGQHLQILLTQKGNLIQQTLVIPKLCLACLNEKEYASI